MPESNLFEYPGYLGRILYVGFPDDYTDVFHEELDYTAEIHRVGHNPQTVERADLGLLLKHARKVVEGSEVNHE